MAKASNHREQSARGKRIRVGICASLLLTTAFVAEARAEADWLETRVHGECSPAPDELAERIARAVAGGRNPSLRLELELERDSQPHARARLRLWRDMRQMGEKQLEAASCAELLEGVVAVAALALSSERSEEAEPAPTGEPNTPLTPTVQTPPRSARATNVRPDRRPQLAAPEQAGQWRVWLAAGLDLASTAQVTPLVSAGTARSFGRVELRLLGRYGLPSTETEVEADLRSLRSEYGAALLDTCLGIDRRSWLSACAGLELRLRHVRRVLQSEGGSRTESSRLEASFGPSAALSLVLRSVAAQPQLELAAQLPLVGAPSALAFRAAVGAGVPF
jgi:hypothetical protein